MTLHKSITFEQIQHACKYRGSGLSKTYCRNLVEFGERTCLEKNCPLWRDLRAAITFDQFRDHCAHLYSRSMGGDCVHRTRLVKENGTMPKCAQILCPVMNGEIEK